MRKKIVQFDMHENRSRRWHEEKKRGVGPTLVSTRGRKEHWQSRSLGGKEPFCARIVPGGELGANQRAQLPEPEKCIYEHQQGPENLNDRLSSQ